MVHDACVLAATAAPAPTLMTGNVLHIDALLDGVWRRATCGCGRSGPQPIPGPPTLHVSAGETPLCVRLR